MSINHSARIILGRRGDELLDSGISEEKIEELIEYGYISYADPIGSGDIESFIVGIRMPNEFDCFITLEDHFHKAWEQFEKALPGLSPRIIITPHVY